MALDYHTIPEIVADNPDDYQGFYPFGVSPSGRYVLVPAAGSTQSIWVLDRADESYITAFDGSPAEIVNYTNASIDDEGTIYAIQDPTVLFGTGALVKIEDFGRGTKTVLQEDLEADAPRSFGLFTVNGTTKLAWGENVAPNNLKVYDVATDALTTVANSNSSTPAQQTLQDSYGDVWSVAADTSHVYFQRIINGGSGSGAPDFNTVAVDSTVDIVLEAYHTSAGWFLNWSGGTDLYLFADTDFSQLAHRSYAVTGSDLNAPLVSRAPFLLGLAPGEDSFWFPGPTSYQSGAYSDLHKINAADLTDLDTKQAVDWLIGDTPDPSPGMIYSIYGRVALASQQSFVDAPEIANYVPVLRYFTEAGVGEDEDLTIRVWSFSHDGHDFYVLRLGTLTLVYDLTTDSWSHWASPTLETWRVHIGQNWVGAGATTMAHGYNSDVVAGDDTLGILWMLDPEAGQDDDPTTGDPVRFTRKVTGEICLSGRDVLPCGAVTLDLAVGDPITGSSITLRTSDDLGQNFTSHGALSITAADYSQVVEWRGLGLMKAPGRIFEISDTGATVRIGAANLR